MVEPSEDWLSAELKALPDLEAPDTVLPKVMTEVRRREQTRFARWRRLALPTVRTAVLGFALAVAVLLVLLNPLTVASETLSEAPLAKTLGLLATAAWSALWQAQVYHVPAILILTVLVLTSYSLCVAAAAAGDRLSRLQP